MKGPPNSYATGLPNDPVFEIFLPDECSLVGRITKQWLVFGKASEGATPEDTYIVNFHQNMDLRTKCLVLSIVFMLVSRVTRSKRFINHICISIVFIFCLLQDYQFYHKTVQGGVSKKCWVWFTIFFISLVVFILVAVDLIKQFQTSNNSNFSVEANVNGTAPVTSTLPTMLEFEEIDS